MKKLNRWQKIVLRIVLVMAAAAAVIAAYAFWPVNEDLSRLIPPDGKYKVTILRDTWGVPHIFGQTDADAAYGLAYAHAEDDFLTIQQTLAASRGMLGQVYGRDAAPADYVLGLLRIRERIDAKYETDISPDVRAIMEAYADGLNHYAALHEEERLLPSLFPVSGKDIIAGFAQRTPLFFGLDGALRELFKEERQREIATKTAAEDAGQNGATMPETAADPRSAITRYGSNTFAVSPARSANGETFLAINAHQPWEGPVAWYEAHVHSEEGWDTYGGTFPGAPLILHGFNRNLGWAFTVNSPDLIDVFVLDTNPENPDQYRFDDEWRDLEVWDVPIKVKLFGRLTWTVKQEALWSVYGPTLRRPHGTYAIRYAGWDEVRYVEQWFRLNKAQDFDSWYEAMRMEAIPMFNAGYADREGNIGYFYNGQIPLREEGYDWNLYLPGNTADTLWTEYVPFDDLPQVINPPSGFIQNANSNPFITTFGPGNPDPADFSPTLGIESRVSNRSLRLLELFEVDDSVTFEEFVAYKYDLAYSVHSSVPEWIAQVTAADLPADPDVQQAAALLREWDLQTTPDSRGATIFMLMMTVVDERNLASFSADALTNTPIPTEVLVQGLTEATGWLKHHFDRVDVPWSEVNRLRRGDADLGLGGGPDILHAVYGELQEDGRLQGIAGDALVLLAAWDGEGRVSARSIHQYGSATLREASLHYADQAPLFVKRQLRPIWLDEADIRAHLERAYRPGSERN
ncbi:MAG: acylase [Anaerolineae bacterium]